MYINISNNKKITLGFNTSGNNSTSGRTTTSVFLGKLKNTPGSLTRKFKYCNTNSPNLNDTFKCVFDIPLEIPKSLCYYQPDAYFSTFRGNDTNFYGQSLYDGPINFTGIIYDSSTKGFNDNISNSTCVIDKNGFIYICGTIFPKLYCFNPDCSLKWDYDTESVNSGGTYNVAPIIGCDGTIYFSSNMTLDSMISKVFAVNPDGTTKWISNELIGSTNAGMPIIGFKLNIFIGTSAGYCYILNDKDGKIIKTFDFTSSGGGFDGYCISIDKESNLFYLNSSNNNFYIANIITGKYKTITFENNSPYSEPVSIGDSVYRTTYSAGIYPAYIYKINKFTGTIDSSYNLSQNNSNLNYGSADNNSPLVDKENNIYIGTSSNGFFKFDKNLNYINEFMPTPRPNFNGASATLSKNNYIYLNDVTNNILYCIDTDLNPISSYDYTSYSSFYSTPAIGKNKLIYIGTQNGLIAIG